ASDAKPPGWHEERLARRRLPVLVLAPTWQQALEVGGRAPQAARMFMHASHEKLRDDVMVPYLCARRWFAAKNEKLDDVRMTFVAPWKTDKASWTISIVEAALAGGRSQRYFLPLALDWEARDFDPADRYQAHALAKVRHKDRVGLFYAAFANPAFPRDIARAMGANAQVQLLDSKLRFSST